MRCDISTLRRCALDLKRLKRETESGKTAAVTPVPPVLPKANPWWRQKVVTMAAAIAVIAVAAIAASRYLVPRASQKIESLAVLPFANATADANTDYLSEGITERGRKESVINGAAIETP